MSRYAESLQIERTRFSLLITTERELWNVKPSVSYQSNKIIPNWLSHLHPLTVVATVRDVSLGSGGYRHINSIAPGHVRTDSKQVCEFSWRQGSVLVLRWKTNHSFRIRKPKWKCCRSTTKVRVLTSSYLSKSCCRKWWPEWLSSVVQPTGTCSLNRKTQLLMHVYKHPSVLGLRWFWPIILK